MNSHWDSGQHEGLEPDETLRLMAKMPAPEGLEERVQRRVDAEMLRGEEQRHSVWSLWMPRRKLQFAGAAVLAAAVAGSAWSVYHGQRAAGNAAVKQAAPAPAKSAAGNGFTPAGAVAVPHTLAPIHVAPAPKRKPGAVSTKPSPKKLVHPSDSSAAAAQ